MIAEFAGDMEAVEHLRRLLGALGEPLEEALKGLDVALLADPQQPPSGVQLIHRGAVALADWPAIASTPSRSGRGPSRRTFPQRDARCPKRCRRCGPCPATRGAWPTGQKPTGGLCKALLAVSPREVLDLGRAATRAVHAAHGADQQSRQAEHQHELEVARLQAVVARSPTAGGEASRFPSSCRLACRGAGGSRRR